MEDRITGALGKYTENMEDGKNGALAGTHGPLMTEELTPRDTGAMEDIKTMDHGGQLDWSPSGYIRGPWRIVRLEPKGI